MARRAGFAALLIVVLSGCSGSVAPPAPTTAPTTAAVVPYSFPPDAKPRCPTDSDGTEDPATIVPATANIFGAGHQVAPQPGEGGAGDLPTVWQLPVGPSPIVSFSAVIGCVTMWRTNYPYNGPEGDGRGRTDVSSYGGIAGIAYKHNEFFLVGVFLSDAEPTGEGPARLEFGDGEDLTMFEPELAQTFFVGDGVGRRYRAPTGATRLFLGFADAEGPGSAPGFYSNNAGEIYAEVEITAE
jgi:hypothetical protein